MLNPENNIVCVVCWCSLMLLVTLEGFKCLFLSGDYEELT